jgi:riboflavin biosynthesis pyrimidine reductase
MEMLLPDPGPVHDLAAVYAGVTRAAREGRPWVLANMVASIDGASSVEGVSGSMGGEPDRLAFQAIRAVADVIVVAGGTVRAEGYHAPRTPEAQVGARTRRGQSPHPRLAVVSGSLDLDLGSSVFVDALPDARPIVLTTTRADDERKQALAEVADVVEVGDERVAAGPALAELATMGAGIVLCEGGPTLLGQLVNEDLVDELCLTLAPVVVASDAARIVTTAPPQWQDFSIGHVLAEDGVLLLDYLRAR